MSQLFCKSDILQNPLSVTDWQLDAFKKFSAKMEDSSHKFPCIPAVLAYRLNHLRYEFAEDPGTEEAAEQAAGAIQDFGPRSKEFGSYASLVIFFRTPDEADVTVQGYRDVFWSLLERISTYDEKHWPDEIPADPHESAWEFCFHGERYFVYCGTPAHQNRNSRSFPYFMLALTPRWVLQEFMENGEKAAKVKRSIRKRLEAYDHVPAHPDLKFYGSDENFEWKQYFLSDDEAAPSRCPFSAVRKKLRKLME
ncbi:YqcI/YcgG family protein [Bacillus marinisedimentorum]|uniref:YqcI/YcgG family protein n=1 Tax=Bacillus marinisedimentorum TaxID=1821260 RepID=UPI0007E20B91|nr:YqcI/YcgG family protein [Bacillus marinisedimentorum]